MAKGPKTLNPADKARREARKKELKKNKKQRLQVRSAVIESKDPEQVIRDLEKLDHLEYDLTSTTSAANTAAYKDKRKKLKEVWEKILVYYQREDEEKYANLKRLEADYETKHKRLSKEYEAIRAAQEIKIEDIFLPPEATSSDEIDIDDPLMSESIYINPLTSGMKPPGCPPGLPPDLKQLVESAKTSMTTPIPQPLPQDLLNMSRRVAPKQNRSFQTRDNRQSLQRSRTFNAPNNPIEDSKPKVAPPATRAAVIESKPVKFMPNTSKFIPASVRSKLNQKAP